MADTGRVPVDGPRVGVVMITRNRRPELLHAVGKLVSLPERPPVVVVDNGSRDGSARAVRTAHPGVDVVALPDNLGSAGRTVGARRLDTPYVAFSDDDSWWAPGALRTAARVLDAYPRLAVVGARILVGPGERLDPVCAQMARSPLPDRRDLPGPPVLGFLACGAVARRAAFLTAGGFDGHFGVGGEEELLALDLVTSGWDLAYVDAVVAHHHPSPSRDPAGRARGAVRNRVWVA
ncbi:MAG: glycosyltransferase, partial [Actinomycetota bacterium]|nr:glycosyltransferase [Actinomycetota bacterium]